MKCATDNWQQVPASVSYQPVHTRGKADSPFLQFKHVSSAISINVNFERPVARDACTNVFMISAPYIPKAYHGTHNKVNPFPGILYLTLLFHSLHPNMFKINLIIPAFAVIQLFVSLCLSVSLSSFKNPRNVQETYVSGSLLNLFDCSDSC